MGHSDLDVPLAAFDEAVGVEADQAVLGEFDVDCLERQSTQPQWRTGRQFREADPALRSDEDRRRMAARASVQFRVTGS